VPLAGCTRDATPEPTTTVTVTVPQDGDGDSTADTKAADSPLLDITWRDRFAEMLHRA